jgi:hypothetical protein
VIEFAQYSITFGTAKKPCCASGAFRSTLSRIFPSFTTSSRRRRWLSMTAVSGSTPSVSTSPSCSTQPRILLNSGTIASTSASLMAIRASLATCRT